MISQELATGLNQQIEKEAFASSLYLSMSSWCDLKGMKGAAAFLRRQSDEERVHMLKIFDFLHDVDEHAMVPSIPKPESSFESINQIMQMVYEHEKSVTQSIFKLLESCNKQDDFVTFNFLQFYVIEQREEESLMRDILDKIKLIGEGPNALYYIDLEMQKINDIQLAKP